MATTYPIMKKKKANTIKQSIVGVLDRNCTSQLENIDWNYSGQLTHCTLYKALEKCSGQ